MNTSTDDNKRPQAVILMGIPASGKSTFCARYFGAEKGYVRINRDTERSRGGVYSLLWKCLSTRRSFVMDNTQVRCEERARLIALASAAGYEVIGYYLQSRVLDCVRRNDARPWGERVPRTAVLHMAAQLEHPSHWEGFDRLYHVAWEGLADYCITPWRKLLWNRREHYDDLALRMWKNEPKQWAQEEKAVALIARLDGRAFSNLTKQHFEKPFDARFRSMMERTAQHLMRCGFQVVCAYHQSDEISLVLYDEQWRFRHSPAKLLSLLAGEASAVFSVALGQPAAFDCRVHFVRNGAGVRDYFRWRRADALRNAFNGYCYRTLRRDGLEPAAVDAELARLSHEEKKLMLAAHGIDFDTVPAWQKYGTFYYSAEQELLGTDPRTGTPVPYRRRIIISEQPNA